VKPWKAICAALVIFAAGLATGIFTDRSIPNPSHNNGGPPPFQGPGRMDRRKAFLEKLDNEVKLTPDQRKQVEALLAESQERIKKMWEPVQPKVHEEYHNTREKINGLLTPEQQDLYAKWRAKMGKDGHDHDRERKEGERKRENKLETNSPSIPDATPVDLK
jgi:hypothetical protein